MPESKEGSTRTIAKAVERWERAKEGARLARQAAWKVEQDLAKITEELAILLVPQDAKPGESFCIWVNLYGQDRLLKVTKHAPMSTSAALTDYTVEWRTIRRQEESA